MDILYEDSELIICIKPPGTPSQPDPSGSEDMTALISAHTGLPSKQIGIVHRLDRPVGGIMVFAKNPKALSALSSDIQQGLFDKSYFAVCSGHPDRTEEALTNWLLRDGRTNASRIVSPKTAGAKEASLTYRILQTIDHPQWGALCLLQVTLHTGRHHQIRVQLAHASLPIWGDTKYSPVFQKRRGWFTIGLFSGHIGLDHPSTKVPMTFSFYPSYEPFAFFPYELQKK